MRLAHELEERAVDARVAPGTDHASKWVMSEAGRRRKGAQLGGEALVSAVPRIAELEGLESSWDSSGIGFRRVVFERLPEVGEAFECHDEQGGRFLTTRVARLRGFEGGELRFQTRSSTYVLRMAATDAKDEVR